MILSQAQYIEKQRRLRRLREKRRKLDIQAFEDKVIRWSMKDLMTTKPTVTKRTKIDDVPVEGLICMCCSRSIEYLTSTLGKIVTTFGQTRQVTHTQYFTPDRNILSVEVVKVNRFPSTRTGRVCLDCVHLLSEVVPEVEDRKESNNPHYHPGD